MVWVGIGIALPRNGRAIGVSIVLAQVEDQHYMIMELNCGSWFFDLLYILAVNRIEKERREIWGQGLEFVTLVPSRFLRGI
jgi:hypothetical protein